MKIKAKIETEKALKVTFEIEGLKPHLSANNFALIFQDFESFGLPFPKKFQARFSRAFIEAFESLSEIERLKFCQPSQAITELKRLTEKTGNELKADRKQIEALKPLPAQRRGKPL